MTTRIYILSIIVISLVVYNIIEWWPNQVTSEGKNVLPSIPSMLDFQLAGQDFNARKKLHVKRDLFQPVIKKTRKKIIKPVEKAVVLPTPTTPSASEIARKIAEQELSQFKLVGILFQGEIKKAFVTYGDDNLTVKINDVIQDKYIVDDITVTNIILRNIKIDIKKKIELIN